MKRIDCPCPVTPGFSLPLCCTMDRCSGPCSALSSQAVLGIPVEICWQKRRQNVTAHGSGFDCELWVRLQKWWYKLLSCICWEKQALLNPNRSSKQRWEHSASSLVILNTFDYLWHNVTALSFRLFDCNLTFLAWHVHKDGVSRQCTPHRGQTKSTSPEPGVGGVVSKASIFLGAGGGLLSTTAQRRGP